MKAVFADTGYRTALLNPKDQLHDKAVQVSQTLGQRRIVTSEMVLDELLAALSMVPQRPLAVRCVEAIRADPNVEIVPQTSLQFEAAFAENRSRRDKEWSLTDCASFVLMRTRGLSEALAHDHHFVQAGFVALLR
ncbi:MAG: type II toxin-antitoxin system VapC family toxin [Planctomycetes bacterium]|nr:type II toxin-antitoxin system VapC family toxin [Planctomycetota bacterium]